MSFNIGFGITDEEIIKAERVFLNLAARLDTPNVKKEVTGGLLETLKPMRDEIKKNTPVRRGNLKRSVKLQRLPTRQGLPPAARVGYTYRVVTDIRNDKPRNTDTRYNQIIGVEYGNVKVPNPAGAMWKAWNDSGAAFVRRAFADWMGDRIEEMADRVREEQTNKRRRERGLPTRRRRGS